LRWKHRVCKAGGVRCGTGGRGSRAVREVWGGRRLGWETLLCGGRWSIGGQALTTSNPSHYLSFPSRLPIYRKYKITLSASAYLSTLFVYLRKWEVRDAHALV
jgi:hypothetical protein